SGTQRSAEHVSTPFAAPMDNRRLAGLTDNVRIATSASGTDVRCSGGHVLEWMFESHASNSSSRMPASGSLNPLMFATSTVRHVPFRDTGDVNRQVRDRKS